jgi:hypothetical protein
MKSHTLASLLLEFPKVDPRNTSFNQALPAKAVQGIIDSSCCMFKGLTSPTADA